MWGVGVAVCGTDLDFLETVIFYFQANRERKKMAVKKVSSVFTLYVYLYVYMCVCVFVCLLALYRRHRLT